MKAPTFLGYEREDGTVGTRNYVAVIPTVFCVNEVVADIAEGFTLCRPLLHNSGCGQLKPDLEMVTKTLIGLGLNPNVGAVLLVGLGCESTDLQTVYEGIKSGGRWVEKLTIHGSGGMTSAVEEGRRIVSQMERALLKQKRTPHPASKIRLGVKCGSSDTTSGIAANPAAGKAVDITLDWGGSAVFGETPEFFGAEHILLKRCANDEVRQKLQRIVTQYEERILRVGVDLRGSQPTTGNIEGGLSTIEEKALGAIVKSGTKPIKDVLSYGERMNDAGLYALDSPGKESEILTGLAAAGANVIVFTTGGGAPQGFPLVPVIKVAGNPNKVAKMREHIDVDASGITLGEHSIQEIGEAIAKEALEVASGKPVAAERLRYDRSVGICAFGPVV
ncbi:MAG TPA: UxaA family hydrolase [Synergistaceae bacterium]|nr:UxaA family hydrolase [Synergistaceae bacterium]